MGEVVNLRQARKRALRRSKGETANSNRAAHGVSKAQRDATAAQRTLDVRRLDAHKVEPHGHALEGTHGPAREPQRETPDGA